MWIKLSKPCACFYPPRTEPAGSIVSIGSPRGAALIAAGIAEPAVEPPDVAIDENNIGAVENNVGVIEDDVAASALVAALSSRRARRGRPREKPTGAFDAAR